MIAVTLSRCLLAMLAPLAAQDLEVEPPLANFALLITRATCARALLPNRVPPMCTR